SGVSSDAQPGFMFAGFSPHKKGARRRWLQQWVTLPLPIVFFESPHRLIDCAQDIEAVFGAERQVTICRELTKRFEQITTCSAAELSAWFNQHRDHQRGEFVLIIHAA